MTKRFTAALTAFCLTNVAVSYEPAIEWTTLNNSLSAVPGIQTHGSAALEVDGQLMLYAFGGNYPGLGDSTNSYYTPLHLSPPQAGPWTSTTFEFDKDGSNNAVGSAHIERTTFSYNGRIYVVGGSHTTSSEPPLNQIRVFEPTATGDILTVGHTFDGNAHSVSLNLGNIGTSAAVDPDTGYLYVVGGSPHQTSLRRFTIDNITGSVSDYTLYPDVLLWPVQNAAGIIVKDGYLYILSTEQTLNAANVQYAPINPDGSPGTFEATSASLPVAHIDGSSALLNGEIYVVGGHTTAGGFDLIHAVHRSVTASNGDIIEWIADAPMPGPTQSEHTGIRHTGIASLGNDGFVVVGGRGPHFAVSHVFVATPLRASVHEWTLY